MVPAVTMAPSAPWVTLAVPAGLPQANLAIPGWMAASPNLLYAQAVALELEPLRIYTSKVLAIGGPDDTQGGGGPDEKQVGGLDEKQSGDPDEKKSGDEPQEKTDGSASSRRVGG